MSIVDQFGNLVTAAIGQTIDLGTTGDGSVSPAGASALAIDSGSSTSGNFTLTRNNGNNTTVVMTATLHGTAQKFTVTMSS